MRRKSKVRLAVSAAVVATVGAIHKAQAGTFYWEGDNSSIWNTNGGTLGTNWSTQQTLNIDPLALPGSGDDIIFYAPNTNTGNLNTTLGQDFSIRSLTFLASNPNPVTISGNTLTVGSGGIMALGGNNAYVINSNVVAGANQTWTNNSSNNSSLTFNGVISGTGSVTIAGNSPFVLNNANTLSGGLTIGNTGSGLSLTGANGSALNLSSLTINGGSTLRLDSSAGGDQTAQNRLADNLTINSGGGTFTLQGTGSTTETVGTLQINSGLSQVIANNGTLTFGSASIPSLSRAIGGAVNFQPNGGAIQLPNVTLSNGIIGGWATIGDVTRSDPGNQLDFATVNGSTVTALSNYQTDFSSATNNTKLNTQLTLAAGTTTVNSLYLTGNADLLFTGTGTNSSSTLVIGSGGILSNAATGTTGISNQPTLQNIALIGALPVNNNTAGPVYSGKITSAGKDLIITTASNLQIDAIITDNGTNSIGLTKNGSGLLDLSAGNNQAQPVTGEIANTYTGITTVNGGTILVNDDRNFGATNATFIANAITLNGGELLTTRGFTFNANRGITVGPQGGTLAYEGGSNWTISQKITGPGGVTFAAVPLGFSNGNSDTITLNSPAGSNTYQGPTILQAQMTAATANITWNQDEQIPDNSAVTITGFAGNNAGINLNGHKETIGSLSGNSDGLIYNLNNTFTVGQNNLSTEYDGAIRGTNTTGNFVKVGKGDLVLGGDAASQYKGSWTINGGRIVNEDIMAGKQMTINSGGGLGGNGTFLSPVTVNSGGALAPAIGTSPVQMLVQNNVTMNAGSALNFLFGSGNDSVIVTDSTNGASTFLLAAGNDVLNITDLGGLTVGTYQLLGVSGSSTFQDNATFSINGATKFNYAVVATNGANGGLDLVVTAGNPNVAWSGAVNGTWDTTTANWSGDSTTWANGDNALFDNTGHNTAITVAAAVSPSNMTFNNSTVAYSFSGAPITTSGSFTMNQVGSVTFNDAATVGIAKLNAGTLTVGATGSFTSSSLQVNNGASVIVNGSLGASTVLQDDGTATFNNASQTLASLNGTGTVNLGVSTTLSPQSGLFTGPINNGNLLMNAPGNQFTATTLNNTGAITVTAGTLVVGGTVGASASIQLGDVSGTNAATFLTTGPATIAAPVNAIAGNTGAISIGGSTADASSFTGTLALNNTAAPVTFTSVTGGTVTYANVIGAGGVNVNGAGTTVFNSASYGGPTTVNAGVLQVNGPFTAPGTVNVNPGGNLVVNANNFNNPVSLNGLPGTNGVSNATLTVNAGFGYTNALTLNGASVLQIEGTNSAQSNLVTGPITLTNGGAVFLYVQQQAAGTSLVNVFNGRINVPGSSGTNTLDGVLQVRNNNEQTVVGVGVFTNVHLGNNASLNLGLVPSAATPRDLIMADLTLDGQTAVISGNSDGSSPAYIRNVASGSGAPVTLLSYGISGTDVANLNGPIFTALGAKSLNFVGSLATNVTVLNVQTAPSGINLTSNTNTGNAFTLNGGTFVTDSQFGQTGTTNLQLGATPGTSGTFLVNAGTFNANRSADATVTYNGGTLNFNASQNMVALNLNANYATPIPAIPPVTGTNTYTVTPISLAMGQLNVATNTTFTINSYTNGISSTSSSNATTTVFPVTTVTAVNTANLGTINAFGPYSGNLGHVSGAGVLNVGDGTNVAVMNVTSFTQSAVNVADGSKLAVLQATPTVTNTVGTLNLNTSGTLDLANHSLLVTTTSNVASYVARAAGPVQANGLNAWTGSGLTSSLVQADAATGNTKQLAVGYFDSRDNANTGLSVPAGQTLVKETVYGDATGDGKVNIADLSVWNNNFGVASPRWSQGDFNYDGKVNIADLSVWNNNFGGHLSGPTPPPAGAVASAASVKLTSSSASPSAEAATPPAGTLELDIDPSTGDATLNSGGLGVAAIEIDSNSGILLPAGWKSLKNNYGYTQWAFPRGTPNSSQIAEFVSDPSPSGQPANLAAGTVIDYGDIFPVGFTNVADLTFSYNLITDPSQGLTATRTGVIVVPEPTGLALAGVAAAGLLGRKRRRRA